MGMEKFCLPFLVLLVTWFLCFSLSTGSGYDQNDRKQAEPLVFNFASSALTELHRIQNHEPNEVTDRDQERDPLPENNASLSSSYQGNSDKTTWCIVKPSTSAVKLDEIIQFSCTQSDVDCKGIQYGGICYNPANSRVSDASVVMNLYYKARGKHAQACNFQGSGLIVTQDPSVDKCIYPA
ncbi:major pollen allergen Ole e 10-like [Diospyros lotus]|uniref:major pollen allergen Ole e 10-like n=1 Tax=Diospyros lotus TaxID=55363 RepID=UPI00224DD375|nr:major pollen allergen Ole e 10-like [Diospyros lotus]